MSLDVTAPDTVQRLNSQCCGALDRYRSDARIATLLQNQLNANKYIAAICAAPLVLANAKILNQHRATCYPGVLKQEDWPEISLIDQTVVIDDRIITSKGPGTAMDFALTLIEVLTNHQTRHTVEQDLVRK